ncbi:MAG: hypothetical protein ABIY50_13860 [Ignavibacteria bacterium]
MKRLSGNYDINGVTFEGCCFCFCVNADKICIIEKIFFSSFSHLIIRLDAVNFIPMFNPVASGLSPDTTVYNVILVIDLFCSTQGLPIGQLTFI